MDWDTALREDNGRINPFGLIDLDRRLRPVGEAYRRLLAEWRDTLPAESLYPPVWRTDEPRAAQRDGLGVGACTAPL